MNHPNHGDVIGIPVRSVSNATEELLEESASVPESHSPCDQCKQDKNGSVIDWMTKFCRKADNYVQDIRDHVSMGHKVSETVKGKLMLGARILHAGSVERVFRQAFFVSEGEKLVKASQCYLSTTAGPIAGMLFISTEKIAFLSDRSLTLTSLNGDVARIPYKVLIPLRRIKKAIPSKNLNKPNKKYLQIVTVDEFEFWFMGFVSYQKFFKYLQQTISRPE